MANLDIVAATGTEFVAFCPRMQWLLLPSQVNRAVLITKISQETAARDTRPLLSVQTPDAE